VISAREHVILSEVGGYINYDVIITIIVSQRAADQSSYDMFVTQV